MLTTGRVVKTLRTLQGLLQSDLHQRTGLHKNIIVDIEADRRIVQAEEQTALEMVFGVSLDTAEKTLAPLLPQSTK